MKTIPVMLSIFLSSAVCADLFVQCPRLINGETVATDVTIHAKGKTIVAIVAGRVAGSPDDTTIELRDATCMPGLIDTHVHITSELNPKRFADRFKLDPADYAGRDGIADDLMDFSFGSKVNIWKSLLLLSNFIIPINKDSGVRANVIWSLGIEYTFGAVD